MDRLVREAEAVRTVMKLLAVGGTSGRERAVAKLVAAEIRRSGLPRARIRHDDAAKKVPFGAEVGNLVVDIPGRGEAARQRPRLFSAHMDTVSIAAGARPVRKGNTIKPTGKTALGADDRAGCAVLLTLAKTLHRIKPDHAPLVLLFTIAEETGLWGARFAEARALKKCAMGFNFDGGDPAGLVVAAPSSDVFTIQIEGAASHAGVHPEKGVSAAVVFAEATARLNGQGWLGRIRKGRERGTSNIGVVEGGSATNIVMPSLEARCEARSHSEKFLDRIVSTIRREFERAARRLKTADGKRAKVRMKCERVYRAFDLGDDSPVVKEAKRAARAVGLKARPKRQFGGLDANWLNAHCPVVTLGTGAHDPHQVGEWLDTRRHLLACEMAVRLATMGEG